MNLCTRRLPRLGLLCLLLLPLFSGAQAAEPLELTTVLRRLDVEHPEVERLGALRARGLLELSSPHRRFGGLSGLLVSPDGQRLEMVGDDGAWVTARALYDAEGNLSGLADATIDYLANPKAWKMKEKFWRDAESLARAEEGVFVAFEHDHRIWRYPYASGSQGVLSQQPEPLEIPREIRELPQNDGIEALETLADGSLLAIGSNITESDSFPAFLLRQGRWQKLRYRRQANYQPDGAALLPDGDLLVLERRFSLLGGLGVRLVRVPGASIEPGALLEGREIARFRTPFLLDNFEGIAARRGARGETLVYLLSDDNFNPLQRNYLLLFELVE